MYDKTYYPYPATDKKHKYFIITNTGKKLKFGAAGYNDYTTYYKTYGQEIADQRKLLYIKRHSNSNENWNDPNTKAYWSFKFLWSYPTKEEAYEKKIKKDLIKLGYIKKNDF
jgi:hypothetical protein